MHTYCLVCVGFVSWYHTRNIESFPYIESSNVFFKCFPNVCLFQARLKVRVRGKALFYKKDQQMQNKDWFIIKSSCSISGLKISNN